MIAEKRKKKIVPITEQKDVAVKIEEVEKIGDINSIDFT
jgi:hypothetical protein